ncbi:MAG: hypothetical protein U0354_10945 [Candidatus Sericytochromatia bacterium]
MNVDIAVPVPSAAKPVTVIPEPPAISENDAAPACTPTTFLVES